MTSQMLSLSEVQSASSLSPCLAKTFERSRIHVSVVFILSTHPPTEAIGLRANTGVDRPARGDNYIGILHNHVTLLVRRAHQIKNTIFRGEVEIHINLRAAHVGVGRHCIPGASRMKMRDAHH